MALSEGFKQHLASYLSILDADSAIPQPDPYEARCADPYIDPELFFPEYARDADLAISHCENCPLIEQCFLFAMQNDLHGVWGGTTEEYRRSIKRALTSKANDHTREKIDPSEGAWVSASDYLRSRGQDLDRGYVSWFSRKASQAFRERFGVRPPVGRFPRKGTSSYLDAYDDLGREVLDEVYENALLPALEKRK